MTWHVAVYEALLHSALAGFVWLAAASLAVLLIREPARKIRMIELALVGLFLLPLLALLPGYPRLAVLPDFTPSPATAEEHLEGESLVTGMTPDASPPAEETPAALDPLPQEGESSAPEIRPPALAEPDAVEPIDEVASPPAVAMSEDLGEPEPAAIALAPSLAPVQLRVTEATQSWNWDVRSWLVAAYLAGVAGMMSWSLVGLVAVWRLIRSARPAGDACRDLLREIAGPASDRVRLLVSPRASQPCAVAWRPTAIVLPEGLVAAADARHLRWVLAHEWSHVERGDVWSWSLSGLARWWYFYQPLLWWLRRQLQLCQDFVADARAARLAAAPEDYAEFLTSVCAQYARPTLAAGLGIGGGGTELERRVVMLVENDRPLEVASPRRWNLVVLPLAILFVAVLAALSQRPNGVAAEPQGDTAPVAVVAEPVADAPAPQDTTAEAVTGPTVTPDPFINALLEGELDKDPVIRTRKHQRDAAKASLAQMNTLPEEARDSRKVYELEVILKRAEAQLKAQEESLRTKILEKVATVSGPIFAAPSAANRPPDALVELELDRDSFILRETLMLSVLTEGLDRLRKKQPLDEAAVDKVAAHIREIERRIEHRKQFLRPWIVAQLSDDLPAAPNKITPGDLLSIEIIVAPEESLADKRVARLFKVKSKPNHYEYDFLVQPDGDLSLGPICGRVNVARLSEVEAEAVIAKQLSRTFTVEEPKVQIGNRRHVFLVNFVEGRAMPFRLQPGDEVQIEAVDSASDQQLLRTETVGEQGVRLGAAYGRVNLLGMSLREAEMAVQVHLKGHFHGLPKVAVVIARPEENAVRAQAPPGATGLPGTLPAFPAGIAPADDTSQPSSSRPAVRPVPGTIPTTSKGSTSGTVVTQPKDGEPTLALVTFWPTRDKLEPLDTVEILLTLKPKVHKDLATGQTGDVFTGSMPQFSGTYVVEPDGDISLPHGYGRVNVKGLDVKQAGAAIRARLSEKLFTRTALPPVNVVKRGRAVFPEGREPAAGYRIRKGDRLLLGESPQTPGEHEVGPEGKLDWAMNPPEKIQTPMEGLTLAEAQEALQKVAVRNMMGLGGGVVDLTMSVKQSVPIFLTIGGWREEADPEVIARLEGDDKTHVERLEREIRELKDMIRGLKDSKQ